MIETDRGCYPPTLYVTLPDRSFHPLPHYPIPFIPCLQSPLWREALDILKLSVSNSASIIAPPTHGRAIPIMDIGTQALPGPTLAFNVDLSKGSSDVELLKDVVTPSSWKRPQASLRRTREKLMNLLNAFGPRPEVAPPNLRVSCSMQFSNRSSLHQN